MTEIRNLLTTESLAELVSVHQPPAFCFTNRLTGGIPRISRIQSGFAILLRS